MKIYLIIALILFFTQGCHCTWTGYVDHTIKVVDSKGQPLAHAVITQEHDPFHEDYGPPMPPRVIMANEQGVYIFKNIPCRAGLHMRYRADSPNLEEGSLTYDFYGENKNNVLTIQTSPCTLMYGGGLSEYNITKNTDPEMKKKLRTIKKQYYETVRKNNPDDDEYEKKRLDDAYNKWENHPIRVKRNDLYYKKYQPYRYDED